MDISISGVDITWLVLNFRAIEEMFLYVPHIKMQIKMADDFVNLVNLKKGDEVTLSGFDRRERKPKSGKEEEYLKPLDVAFVVLDFSVVHNPRVGGAYVDVFAILKMDNDLLYKAKRHRSWNEGSVGIFSAIAESSGLKVDAPIASSDSMRWIQAYETDVEFLKRVVSRSYFSGSDYLSFWVGVDGSAKAKTFGSLSTDPKHVFDPSVMDMEAFVNSGETDIQDPIDKTSTRLRVPCTGLKVSNLFGSAQLGGASGGVLLGYDPIRSMQGEDPVMVDGFKAEKMGTHIPILEHEFGLPSITDTSPSYNNGIVHENYGRSRTANIQFWNLLKSNSVQLVCPFYDGIKIGDSFVVEVSQPHVVEDDVKVKSLFIRNAVFVVYGMVHTYSSEDARVWTTLYGVSFGISKNERETTFPYVVNS